MAYGFVAEDFVAICLLLLEGDAQRSTWELIQAVEAYQTQQKGHFGMTDNDLRSTFYFFCIEQKFFTYEECKNPPEKLFLMPFSQLIPIILKEYTTFYCNDHDNSLDREPVLQPSMRRKQLMACFAEEPTPAKVRALLTELGWSKEKIQYFLQGRSDCWEESSVVEEVSTNVYRLR